MKKNMKSLKGKNIVSLDICFDSIAVIYGKRTSGGIKVKKAFSVDLPKGCFVDGTLMDYDLVLTVLKNELKKNKIPKNKYAVSTFTGKDVIARVITLPDAKPEQLIRMIKIEMQQHIPIDLSNFVVQYKIQDSYVDGNVKYNEILVVATPKDFIADMFRLIKGLGLKAAIIDWQPNSANKLLYKRKINDVQVKEESTIAIANIHKNYTSFSILDNGKNKYYRMITVGSKELYHSLNKESIHDMIKVEEISDDFIETLDTRMDEDSIEVWLDELERILKFYYSREVGNKVECVYIYGDIKGIEKLSGSCEKYLGVKTSLIKTIDKVYVDQDIKKMDTNIYINALGAIISDYKFGKLYDFDFFEPYLTAKIKIKMSSTLSLGLILLSLSFVGYDYYKALEKIGSIQDEIIVLDQKIENENIHERLNILEQKQKEYDLLVVYNSNLNLIKEASENRNAIDKVSYYTFIGSIPDNVLIDSIDIGVKDINLSATATNDLVIAELEKRLRTTGLFNDLNVDTITYNEEEDNYTFSISFTAKGVN